MKILRQNCLCAKYAHLVFYVIVVSHVIYCMEAWSGLVTREHIDRIDKMFKKVLKLLLLLLLLLAHHHRWHRVSVLLSYITF